MDQRGLHQLADGLFEVLDQAVGLLVPGLKRPLGSPRGPLLGPQLMELAKKVVAGETVPDRVVTQETEFTPEQAKAELPKRKY